LSTLVSCCLFVALCLLRIVHACGLLNFLVGLSCVLRCAVFRHLFGPVQLSCCVAFCNAVCVVYCYGPTPFSLIAQLSEFCLSGRVSCCLFVALCQLRVVRACSLLAFLVGLSCALRCIVFRRLSFPVKLSFCIAFCEVSHDTSCREGKSLLS